MGQTSKIQWTDATWNIAVGCNKVDADCKFCYMFRQSLNKTRFTPDEVRRTKPPTFNMPLKLKEPSKIFASSFTDFFHEAIDSYRMEAWEIIRQCPQHTFQILTKRPERILDNLPPFWDEIRGRVWLGTSVGSDAGQKRIYELLKVRYLADILFISFEPLHGAISNFDISTLCNIDWIIIGGESGNETGKYRYRPCELQWIRDLILDFRVTSAVFVKQLGTHLAKELGLKDRHGGDWDEWPEDLRIREFPKKHPQWPLPPAEAFLDD